MKNDGWKTSRSRYIIIYILNFRKLTVFFFGGIFTYIHQKKNIIQFM